jgi:CubicO group peptidase (beta-lactamase class C family)
MNYNSIKEKINQYMKAYTNLWAFSGSIIAVKDGQVLYNKAYGYANIEHKVPNTTKTKYRLWSITKQFTAAAILMLEERGLLNLNNSVKQHLPECAALDERITIHHLLTHTSGIANYSNFPNSSDFHKVHHDRPELIKLLMSTPLDFEPGTQWNYSNSGYYLLGVLIEKLSGKSYSEFLEENIFKPLGMMDTGVDDNKTIVENKASGYYLNGDSLIHCDYTNMNLIFSSGSLYSTVEDLILWDKALNSGKLLSRESIEKMNTPYKNDYGYGVGIHMNNSRKVVHHNGGHEGFLTEIHRYVDDDFTVVVLSNYGFTAVNKLCKVIASIAFEETYELPVKPEEFLIDESILESYIGIYEAEGLGLEVKREEDKIFFTIDEEYILPMYPITESVFHHTWIDEEYSFTKDEEGDLYFWGIKKKTK